MAWDWDFIMGRRQMPEGFPALLAQTVDTAGPLGTYSYKLEADYWFYLEAVLAKWTAPTVLSVPGLQIFREGGQAGEKDPVDFRLLTSPGEAPLGVAQVGRVVGLGMYFPPGGALGMRFTGFVAGNPATITVVAFGRYVLKGPDNA
jgi:hypothetical protein